MQAKTFITAKEAFSMSSLITAVFKATIGLVVKKGRDKLAEKLDEGDLTDQKFRGMIVREIDEIRKKLDGLARKDLLASISFFEEGIVLLYEVFEKARFDFSSDYSSVTSQGAVGSADAEPCGLTGGLRQLTLTGLDEAASRKLTNAKKRFERARERATDAFANEALVLSDRVLAMQYRVMSTILETVDNPADAMAACGLCIEELHCLPGIKECFKAELKRGFRAWLSKDERGKLISTVCLINRTVYDVTLIVDFGRHTLENWPCVDIGEKEVSPLRNESIAIAKVLKKYGMENCSVPWSLGQDSTEMHEPWRIATSAQGHFLIVDLWGPPVKVFDNKGNFYLSIFLERRNLFTKPRIIDIGTAHADMDGKIYLLIELEKIDPFTGKFVACERPSEVHVFNKTGKLLRIVSVRSLGLTSLAKLTVTSSKLLLLIVELDSDEKVVDVYELSGESLGTFGEGMWTSPTDITATCDGHVMIVDHPTQYDSCVYVFTVEGRQLTEFNIGIRGDYYHSIACHPTGEHFVLAGCTRRSPALLRLAIYTADGAYVQKIQLDEEVNFSALLSFLYGVSVTMEGHIALSFQDKDANRKVIVV